MVSFVLALIVAEMVFPTPNAVGGGSAKMFLLIFFTVGFKVVIEFWVERRRRKLEKKDIV
jgi:hypothetical protein